MAKQQTGFEVKWDPTNTLLAEEVAAYDESKRVQSGLLCLPCGCVYREKPQKVVITPCYAIMPRWMRMRELSQRMFGDPEVKEEASFAGQAVAKHLTLVKAYATRVTKKAKSAKSAAGFERASGSWQA